MEMEREIVYCFPDIAHYVQYSPVPMFRRCEVVGLNITMNCACRTFLEARLLSVIK